MTTTPAPQISLLLADDDAGIITSGKMLFEDEGWSVSVAKSVAEVIRKVEKQEFDVALVDMNYTRDTTSGAEGLELISKVHEIDPDLPILVMTAWATIDIAVEALKRGASDFIPKPWENDRVVQKVSKMALNTRSLRKGRLLQAEAELHRQENIPDDFIAHSPAMQSVMQIVNSIGPSEANVMILGENGTGKSVIAQLIHGISHRAEGPFISVNMGGLAEGLFESEIFGHVKGAFTDAKADRAGRFEIARGGTIFLDEIGNITLNQQNRLLRLLETGEFERVGSSRTIKTDARVISATNAPLKEKVADKSFREDLYYRLNTVIIDMPPMRDRREDVLPLAHHFLSRLNRKYRKSIRKFSSQAEKVLLDYHWPGNVREMNHAIERAVLMCHTDEIHAQQLMLEATTSSPADIESMSMEDIEKLLIQKALKRNGGNVTAAAKQLGLSRATFYRRLQDYGI
ncbi:MAG: sigma-54 dependent transcriptional regulator [Opitutales bacterium]|nr:sigma-54 dependent transcriptional regulator [Opitutales bacterium]